MLGLIAWVALLLLCWPLALLVLLVLPLAWLVLLPFRIAGVAVGAVFSLLGALLFLPVRVVRAL